MLSGTSKLKSLCTTEDYRILHTENVRAANWKIKVVFGTLLSSLPKETDHEKVGAFLCIFCRLLTVLYDGRQLHSDLINGKVTRN